MNTLTLLVIENIALMALVAFLCWYFESWWPILILLALNKWNSTDLLDRKSTRLNSSH